MKLTKKMITLTTLLLTFALLFMSVPLQAIALGTDTPTTEVTSSITDSAEATAEATESTPVVSEVIDRREETVKHFDMGDGTFRAVSYGYPVHKRDASGTWQEIDNSLSLVSGGAHYGTADARVRFAKSPTATSPLMMFSENGYEIKTTLLTPNTAPGMGSISATDTVVPIVRNAEKPSVIATDDNETQFHKLKAGNQPSEITYAGILHNVDIGYEVSNTGVTESIVLNTVPDNNTFTYQLEVTALTVMLDGTGTVLFCDPTTYAVLYTLSEPDVFDGNGTHCYNVHYELTVREGLYVLAIVVDEAWLNSADRVLPLTVKSVLTTYLQQSTFIDANYPTADFSNAGYLCIAQNAISYLKFNKPSLPDEASIMTASLNLSYYPEVSGYPKIGVYMLTEDFAPSLTWNDAIEKTNMGIEQTPITVTGNVPAGMGITQYEPATYVIGGLESGVKKLFYENMPELESYYGFALKLYNTDSAILHIFKEGYDAPTLQVSYAFSRAVKDGTYMLQSTAASSSSDSPPQVIGTTASSSTPTMEEFNLNEPMAQLWVFSSLSNGYYQIRSYESGKWLSFNGSSLYAQSGTSGVNQQWQVLVSPDDNYILVPRSGIAQNKHISIQGTSLGISSYNSEENATDWKLERVYPIRVHIKYDLGYRNRHTESSSNDAHILRIEDSMNEVIREVYNQSNIILTYTDPILSLSYADSCSNPNYTDRCTCDSCENSSETDLKPYHHKNKYNVFYRYAKQEIPTNIDAVIVFTGHILCESLIDKNGNIVGHVRGNTAGTSSPRLKLALIMDNTANEDSTILHEFLHLYGAPDHYGNGALSTEEKNNNLLEKLPNGEQLNENIAYHEDCLYGENSYNQEDPFHLCNGCKNDIRNYLNAY